MVTHYQLHTGTHHTKLDVIMKPYTDGFVLFLNLLKLARRDMLAHLFQSPFVLCNANKVCEKGGFLSH